MLISCNGRIWSTSNGSMTTNPILHFPHKEGQQPQRGAACLEVQDITAGIFHWQGGGGAAPSAFPPKYYPFSNCCRSIWWCIYCTSVRSLSCSISVRFCCIWGSVLKQVSLVAMHPQLQVLRWLFVRLSWLYEGYRIPCVPLCGVGTLYNKKANDLLLHMLMWMLPPHQF